MIPAKGQRSRLRLRLGLGLGDRVAGVSYAPLSSAPLVIAICFFSNSHKQRMMRDEKPPLSCPKPRR